MQHTDPPYVTIRRHWVDLRAAAVAGTAHPRTTSIARWIPPAVLADRDRLAREERAERVDAAPGERPVPADLDAVQAAIAVSAVVLAVDDRIRRHLGLTLWMRDETHPMTVPGACSDIEVHVRLLDDDTVASITAELAPAARLLLRALDLADDPITLTAPCPGCAGPLVLRAASPIGPHVLCTGTEPCTALATTWLAGRPLWAGTGDLALLGDTLNTATASAA